MRRKILIGTLVGGLALSLGLFLWAKSVFTQENVRAALAAQLSKSLGQPVAVGGIGARIYPRVTVNLTAVTIGEPARIRVETLHIGTGLRALLSRRIEHAALRLSGARVELPLPEFAIASTTTAEGGGSSAAPVELVSIDEIVLNDVDIVSGGRTLHGDIELEPRGAGVIIRRMTLSADDAALDITGVITDLSGPSGELAITAGALDFDSLLAFASAFAGGAGTSGSAGGAAAPSTMNIAASIAAESATLGTLSLQNVSGRARILPDRMMFDPIGFGLFGGKYEGSLMLTPGGPAGFRLKAALAGIDMAAATAFAGSPDTLSGRLSATIDLAGVGIDAANALNTAKGSARVDITNGTVKNLGLVRTIIIATSGRSDTSAASAGGSRDEPFSRLGATLLLANGTAATNDLRFESDDLLLDAAGTLRLDGSAIKLAGQVQLSDTLSQQAGRDLLRYTQEQSRVTLPATITGSAQNPQVRIDVASLAKRAITNRAKEEVQGAIKKGLGGLFRK
jgi:uncharacterized protein involved in outer membrane biogenesis